MNNFGLVRAVLAVGSIVFGPVSAGAATVLTGTFAGTSVNTQIFQMPFGNFDNTPASGQFRIDLTGCVEFSDPSLGPNCGASSGPANNPNTYLMLNTAEGPLKIWGQEHLARVINAMGSQTLSINFDFGDPYSSSRLDLVGPVDAFIHGVDFSKLYAGPVDVGASMLQYQDGRFYRGEVALTSLVLTSVPEPASWAALATMMAIGAAGARMRRTSGVRRGTA